MYWLFKWSLLLHIKCLITRVWTGVISSHEKWFLIMRFRAATFNGETIDTIHVTLYVHIHNRIIAILFTCMYVSMNIFFTYVVYFYFYVLCTKFSTAVSVPVVWPATVQCDNFTF